MSEFPGWCCTTNHCCAAAYCLEKITITVYALKAIYYDPASSGSYGRVSPLLTATRNSLPGAVFTRKDVVETLRTQDTYILHRTVRQNFSRTRILVSRIDDVWQTDLVDMQFKKKHTLVC